MAFLRTAGRRPPRSSAADLCARWREASLGAGWAFPQDWWVPAVDAVAEALCEGRDPVEACTRLGRARAEAAVGLEEALADLAALQVALRVAGPPATPPAGVAEVPGPLVAAVALGWAEIGCGPAATGGCADPLTGLVTPAYLLTRLGEVYREAERAGESAAATHALVLVALGVPGAALVQLGRGMLVGDCLRTAFSGDETLCAVGPHRSLALVRRDRRLAASVTLLRRLLADGLDPDAAHAVRVWVEGLPGTLGTAHRLVDDLAR